MDVYCAPTTDLTAHKQAIVEGRSQELRELLSARSLGLSDVFHLFEHSINNNQLSSTQVLTDHAHLMPLGEVIKHAAQFNAPQHLECLITHPVVSQQRDHLWAVAMSYALREGAVECARLLNNNHVNMTGRMVLDALHSMDPSTIEFAFHHPQLHEHDRRVALTFYCQSICKHHPQDKAIQIVEWMYDTSRAAETLQELARGPLPAQGQYLAQHMQARLDKETLTTHLNDQSTAPPSRPARRL